MSFQSLEQRDLIVDLIQKLGESLRALVGGQQTHALDDDDAEDALDDVEEELEATFAREFGALHEHVQRLTPASVVSMIRPLGRLRSYASLLGYRALIALRRRETPARARGARALELLRLVQAEERALPAPPAHTVDPALVRSLAAAIEGDERRV